MNADAELVWIFAGFGPGGEGLRLALMNADLELGFLQVLDYAAEFDFGLLEVYEEAEGFSGGAEIVDALGRVFLAQVVGAFEFDQENVFDKTVGEEVSYTGAFVVNGEGGLGLRLDVAVGEFED